MSAPRAPGSAAAVASGAAGVPAAARAAAIRWAVTRAVPDGASILPVVMELDDLDAVEEDGGALGEPHHQHGGHGEVGRDHDTHARVAGGQLADLGEAVVVEAGGADDDVDAVSDAVPHRVHHHVGPGEVDGHLGARRDELVERVPVPDLRHEFHVLGGSDGRSGSGAHPPVCADHADPGGHRPSSLRVDRNGPTTAIRGSTESSRFAAALASASVTASIIASRSSVERCAG